jgi:hypothetical protein
MARQRDYAAEYRRRIERGTAAGRTRQEARGHREEVRAPGEESTYQTRANRSIARRLRDRDGSLTRSQSIQRAYQYMDRFGIPNTRRLLDKAEHASRLYQDRDPRYPEVADDLGAYWDDLNDRFESTAELEGADYDDWEGYIEIDFGDPPDYAICLFYH